MYRFYSTRFIPNKCVLIPGGNSPIDAQANGTPRGGETGKSQKAPLRWIAPAVIFGTYEDVSSQIKSDLLTEAANKRTMEEFTAIVVTAANAKQVRRPAPPTDP